MTCSPCDLPRNGELAQEQLCSGTVNSQSYSQPEHAWGCTRNLLKSTGGFRGYHFFLLDVQLNQNFTSSN